MPDFENEIRSIFEIKDSDYFNWNDIIIDSSMQYQFCMEEFNPVLFEEICEDYYDNQKSCCYKFWQQRFEQMKLLLKNDWAIISKNFEEIKVLDFLVFEDFDFDKLKENNFYPYQLYLFFNADGNDWVIEMDVTYYHNKRIFQFGIDGHEVATTLKEYIEARSINQMIERHPPGVEKYFETITD